MIRDQIKNLIKQTLSAAALAKVEDIEIEIEQPENKEFGDYSTNVAMKIAKIVKKSPMEIAEMIGQELKKSSQKSIIVRVPQLPFCCGKMKAGGARTQTSRLAPFARRIKSSKNKFCLFKKIEVAKPGFINFYLAKEYLQQQVTEILGQAEKFGQLEIGQRKRVQIEFISANPTGPLTLGNGRGGFFGHLLSNILERAGYAVEREYYINDLGEQIKKLGHSIIGDEPVYQGAYIENLRKQIKLEDKTAQEIGEEAAKMIMEKMIKPTIEEKMKIKFDSWFFESSLYQNKRIDEILEKLKEKNLVYEKDGACWFKSSQFGDDKDRVLKRENGQETYFLSDIAYHYDKFVRRKFEKVIDIWGADHHGYVSRLQAAKKALTMPGQLKIIIMQLVRLFEGKKEVRMSKRTGTFITLDELLEEIPLDVARFFFLMRSADSHLNFDLDLAKEQTEKNPVYYIQYAYARIHSILKKSKIQNPNVKSNPKSKIQKFNLLTHGSEFDLIKKLIQLPEIIEDTARDYQVQRLPHYALDLVTAFHKFYEGCRVLSEDKNLTQARLGLVEATRVVLKNVLDLMGISAPERM